MQQVANLMLADWSWVWMSRWSAGDWYLSPHRSAGHQWFTHGYRTPCHLPAFHYPLAFIHLQEYWVCCFFSCDQYLCSN